MKLNQTAHQHGGNEFAAAILRVAVEVDSFRLLHHAPLPYARRSSLDFHYLSASPISDSTRIVWYGFQVESV
jgi:hypothetical protein